MSTGPTSLEEVARQAVWELSAEAAGIGTYVLHLSNGTMDMDERALALTGMSEHTGPIRPQDVFARIPSEEVADVAAAIDHAIATAGTYSAEHRIIDSDGTCRWVAVRGQTLTDHDGATSTLIGALYDITALREATARVSEVLGSMAVGYLSLDSDWRITYVNTEGERIAGSSRDELVGADFWATFPATVDSQFERSYRRAVATAQTVTFDAYYPAPLDVWVEVRAVPEAGGLGLYFLDITARRAAEDTRDTAVRQQTHDAQAMAGLVAAARDLGTANTESEVLGVVSRYAEALLGIRGCALSLPDPDGSTVRSLSASYDDDVLATFDHLPADHPLPAVHTAVTGTPNFLPDLATITARFPGCEDIYTAGGIASSAAVPLRARGHLLGSLSVGHPHDHLWRPAEQDLLAAFAALTAQALDRLASHQAEQQAVAQQAGLVAIAHALGEAGTEDDVLTIIAAQGSQLLGSNGAGLCLREPDGAHVRSLVTADYDGQVGTLVQLLPADFPLPAIHAAASGSAHFLPDRASTEALFPGAEPIYAAVDVQASAAAPLRAHGSLLGCLSMGFASTRTWESADRDLIEALAALTAQALARINAHEAERAASAEVARFSETLQRSLLTSPPEPDHLQIAVRYVPAAADAQVGGDWYDAFMTSGGTTSLVIGDVAGHDSRAAAAMGQLRNLLRGIGYTIGGPPAAVLTVLDRAVHDLAVDAIASLVIAQVEQPPEHRTAGTRVLRWSNAGHPPPLLITAEGAVGYLDAAPDLLVGVDPGTTRADHTVVLQPGSSVLLFTDGLIERRGAPLQAGLDWLADAVTDLAHLPPEELCDALLDQVGGQVEDDVALLALRAHPEDAPRPVGAGPARVPLHEPTLSSETAS